MNVLFLSQGTTLDTHPGWHWALNQLQHEGVIENFLNIPYIGYAQKYGWKAFFDHAVALCQRSHYDVVYFQHWHGGANSAPEKEIESCIGQLSKLVPRPIILTSCGDPYSHTFFQPHYPKCFRVMSRLADITFSSQMGLAADKMMSWGTQNIVFTPLAACPVRFKPSPIDTQTHSFEFDVVWIGNRNQARNPLNRNFFQGRHRAHVVRALESAYGKQFGLFGYDWAGMKSWRGQVPFDEQQSYFRKGRVVVDARALSFADYYASDRPFYIAISGVPLVMCRTPRFDRILRANDQCYFVDSPEETVETCNRLLKSDPEELYAKAAQAASYVAEHHTQYHRLKFKLDTAMRYRANRNQLDVRFPFFLPEVDVQDETRYAVRRKANS